MGYRVAVQKNEAELSVTLLLWRERKCHLYSGLVYIDSPVVIDSNTKDRTGKESLLGGGIIGSNPFDQQSGSK